MSDGRWTIVRLSPVDAGGLVGVWSDVTAIKEREALYELMALTDALTKLPNRVLFRQRLTDAIKHAKRTNQHVVVMFIDLDRFKLVNDIYGHAAGDRVLTVVASRLLNAVRETDTVARLGGDEFAVVMEHVSSIENIGLVAQKILDLMVETIEFEGEQCRIGASIGISIFPEHGEDAAGLLRLADEAMYAVKEAGRDGYRVADAARPEQSSGEA